MFRSFLILFFLAGSSLSFLSMGCVQDNRVDTDTDTDSEQPRGGKGDTVLTGSCEGACGDLSTNGNCWCDDNCERYGDCCDDNAQICNGSPTGSNLLPRLGGLAVYDVDRDITWLTDANAAAGTIYDDGNITDDGSMSWTNAKEWVQSLTVGGFSDWRLPTVPVKSNGGYCAGSLCTDSEMGHLFYDELSGTPGESILNSDDPNLDLFVNIQSRRYWTVMSNGGPALFDMNNGSQFPFARSSRQRRAWAVRTGDVQ